MLLSTIVQIRKRGSLTIPMHLRKRYQLEENDPVTLVDLGEGIFISPKQSLLPKLAAQIEKLREEQGITLEDLVRSVQAERM